MYLQTASTFNPDIAVDGQGRWIVIDSVRYWSPYTYVVDQNDEWVPYQNGYWNWSEGYGYTWVSYDPWGWATDHYGVWRHHGVYGWMWLPFDDHHYEPNCVTFFDNNTDHIGWYPYSDSWADGYRHNDQQGFDDGFWLGNASVRGYGDRDAAYNYHQGFTDVPYEHFREIDLFSFRDRTDGDVRELVGANRFGHNPGMYTDAQRDESLTYLQARAGGALEITQTATVRSRGGAEILRPVVLHQAPAVYAGISRGDNLNHPVAVGTVYGAGKLGSAQGVRPIAPSTNGRGVSAPPRATDPKSGTVSVLPARARNPMQPTRTNPIVGTRPVSAPVKNPTPVKVPTPVYHPPVKQQPVQKPPVRQQPVQQPPVKQEPVQQPPVKQQPVQQPPVKQQPVQKPPVRQQPVPQPRPQQPAPQPRPQQPAPQPRPQQPAPQPRPQQPAPQPRPQQPAPQPRPQQPAPQPQQPRPTNPGKR